MEEKKYRLRTLKGTRNLNYRTKLRYYKCKFAFEMLTHKQRVACELKAERKMHESSIGNNDWEVSNGIF
tara:strand:- start:158 stop:364 length:207 start_codon:yes stop_codon:yes gene_type:complete